MQMKPLGQDGPLVSALGLGCGGMSPQRRRGGDAVRFSADELAALDRAFAPGAITGDRYPAFVQQLAAQ